MQPSETTIKNSCTTLLDELKLKESFSSDAKLAEALGVTRGYICSIRRGRKEVSAKLAKQIFSRLGRAFEIEDYEELFTEVKARRHASKLSIIRKLVMSRAEGRCQLCNSEAPFLGPDGTPYLELHHIIPASNGGSDSFENLVALCPNCHRKTHLCPIYDDLNQLNTIAKNYLKKH